MLPTCRATAGTLSILFIVVAVAGCGGTTAHPSSTRQVRHAAPLSAQAYRAVLEQLARQDTGEFETVVVRRNDADDSSVAQLPRMRGAWRISTSASSATTQSMGGDGRPTYFTYRLVKNRAYFVWSDTERPTGRACWVGVNTAARKSAGGPGARKRFGPPAALTLIENYRPAGSDDAGTVRLYDVLGAVGFEKLANSAPTMLRSARVPMDIQLRHGRLFRAFIYPADVVEALSRLPRRPLGGSAFTSLFVHSPLLFWGIQYSRFRGDVSLAAPRADRVVVPGRTPSRCSTEPRKPSYLNLPAAVHI